MKRLPLLAVAWLALAPATAPAAPHAEKMMRATFKFFSKASTATCFLLRDESGVWLVTAAHTMEKARGDTAIVVLRVPTEDGSGYQRKDVTIPIRESDQTLWTKHPEHDVAVLPVSFPHDPDAALPMSALETEGPPAFGDPLIALTYPARVEANSAGFPLARQAIVASFPDAPIAKDPVFVLDMTSWDGDSGGPVFRDDGEGSPRIVGLVIQRVNHIEKIKSQRESREVITPMGLSKALDASVITETINLARSKAPAP